MSKPARQQGVRRSGIWDRTRVDLILAIAAIFISALSLVVAIRTEQSQRDTLAAGTWPTVQRNFASRGAQGNVTIGVVNDGVGPAKIRSVEMFFDGRPVTSTRDLLRQCCDYRPDLPDRMQLAQGYAGAIIDNTVLRAGESVDLITVPPSQITPDVHRRLGAVLRRITFRGCYCSVLDHCWAGDLASLDATPVSACPAPTHPFDPIERLSRISETRSPNVPSPRLPPSSHQ